MVTLRHVEDSLWFCDEMGQTGEISIAPNRDILFEFFDYSLEAMNLKRWQRHEVTIHG
jgi:hypothetical protein